MAEKNYILSLESSSDMLGIALSSNSKLLVAINYYKKNLHDRLMAEITNRILADFDLQISDLSAVAVASGPGSFTGLRISSAFAKGLCFANELKFIAVPNLSAFAYYSRGIARSQSKKNIYSTVISHKDIIYYQKFNVQDFSSDEIMMTTIEEFSNLDFSDAILVGNAVPKLQIEDYIPEFTTHKVEMISKYANKLFLEEIFENVEDFEPLYVQDFVPKTSSKKLNI